MGSVATIFVAAAGVLAVVVAVVGAVLVYRRSTSRPHRKSSDAELLTPVGQSPSEKRRGTARKLKGRPPARQREVAPDHSLFLDTVRGVPALAYVTSLALSPDAQQIALAISDGTLKVLTVVTPPSSDPSKDPLSSTQSTPPTYLEGREKVSAIDFACDGLSLFAALEYRSNLTQVKIVSKDKPLKQVYTSDVMMHMARVKELHSSHGLWILTIADDPKDTSIRMWSYTGEPLYRVDTKQVRNNQLTISPITGRFFGAAAWTSGVKLFEVTQRGGEFSKGGKALDLKSSCGTLGVAVSHDDRRAVVLSKDRTLTLWDIDVRYRVSEDAKKLTEVQLAPHYKDDNDGELTAILAFVPVGNLIALLVCRDLLFFDATTLTLVETIEKAHSSHIFSIVVPRTPEATSLITVASEGKPRIWQLPTRKAVQSSTKL